MGQAARWATAGRAYKEMKKVSAEFIFANIFFFSSIPCLNVNCGENWNLWCVENKKKKSDVEKEGTASNKWVLMKIGFGLVKRNENGIR